MRKSIVGLLFAAAVCTRPVSAEQVLKIGNARLVPATGPAIVLPKIFGSLSSSHFDPYQKEIVRLCAGIQVLSPSGGKPNPELIAGYLRNAVLKGDQPPPVRAAAAASLIHQIGGNTLEVPVRYSDSAFPANHAISAVVRRYLPEGIVDRLNRAVAPFRSQLLSRDGTEDAAMMSQMLRTLYSGAGIPLKPVSFHPGVVHMDGFLLPRKADLGKRPAHELIQPFYGPTQETVAELQRLRLLPGSRLAVVDAPRPRIPALVTTIAEIARLESRSIALMSALEGIIHRTPDRLFLTRSDEYSYVETAFVRAMRAGQDLIIRVENDRQYNGAVQKYVEKMLRECKALRLGAAQFKFQPGFFVWIVRETPKPVKLKAVPTL